MHFDAAALRAEERLVTKCVEIEIGPEFAVHARQEIEIELCRDARRIIVSRVENVRIFHEIDADDQSRAGSQYSGGILQKCPRLMRLEIADCQAWKEPGPGQ